MPKDEGDELMNGCLGVDIEDIMIECKKLKEGHINFSRLQEIFNHKLTKALHFDNRQGMKIVRDHHRTRCIITYLFFLVGYTIFNAMYLNYFRDLTIVY